MNLLSYSILEVCLRTNNALVLLKQLWCLCWRQSCVTVLVTRRVHALLKIRRCENIQAGVVFRTRTVLRLPLGTKKYLFSLFCMKNYFVFAWCELKQWLKRQIMVWYRVTAVSGLYQTIIYTARHDLI